MSKNLRAEMPTVAAWIDELREAFGADQINPAIKAGITGQPTFYAKENGLEVGTPQPDPKNATAAHDDGFPYHPCAGCIDHRPAALPSGAIHRRCARDGATCPSRCPLWMAV